MRVFLSIVMITTVGTSSMVNAGANTERPVPLTANNSEFLDYPSLEEAIAIASQSQSGYQDPCTNWGFETQLECSIRGEHKDAWYRPKLRPRLIPIEYWQKSTAEVPGVFNSQIVSCKSDWSNSPNNGQAAPLKVSSQATIFDQSRGPGRGHIVIVGSTINLARQVSVRFNGGRPIRQKTPAITRRPAKSVPEVQNHSCNGKSLKQYSPTKTDEFVASMQHLYPVPSKPGTYDVTFVIRIPGQWNCCIYYRDFCKWFSPGDLFAGGLVFKVKKKDVVVVSYRDLVDSL